jgi:uncharacterized protein YyaL (SSP411 family)
VTSARTNRLAREKSPYLLQHAHNPVDWYPWGDEAFKKAKAEDKPIFLSIGYSTCHWCHVMENESFEDDEVARLLNETFVSIKVDREERPDIDSYYMTVCGLLSGTGGWPLTIIMSPAKQPFFASTYLPKMSRFGRIGLLELIPQVANIWKTRREKILKSSGDISELVKQASQEKGTGKLTDSILQAAYEGLVAQYDEKTGGFGNAPKFPTPHNLFFLMRHWQSTGQEKALHIVEHTLTAMRMGGIYDHTGYGFHRYSTDAQWHLPHFEKMSYDQALLTLAYTEAYQITKKQFYKVTAGEIIEYVLRDMISKQGAFYSAEDADSEGQEGKFYLWAENEIAGILNVTEYKVIKEAFNIQTAGNYVDEATRQQTGRNLLHMSRSHSELAVALGISEDELMKHLTAAREKMFRYREKRTHPHKDKKILCDWNGIMIAALSKAGRILEKERYIKIAKRAADFLLTEMLDSKGQLYHRYIDGERAIQGFLDDYAFLAWGLIELYEASFNTRYLQAAIRLNELTKAIFGDTDGGAFFFTPKGNELPLRKKEKYDGAVPSGNSLAMLNMLRLARLTGHADLEEQANQIAENFAYAIQQHPLNHVQMLIGLNQALFPSPEIVITGNTDDSTTQEMLGTINQSAVLDVLVLFKSTNGQSEIMKLAPFTSDLSLIDNRATAYLCRNYQCEMPTNDSSKLARMLDESVKTTSHLT